MPSRHWLLPAAVISAITVAASSFIAELTDYPTTVGVSSRLFLCLAVVFAIGFVRLLAYLFRLWRADVSSPLAAIKGDWRQGAGAFLPILAGVIIVGLFIQAISVSKSFIPAVVPFWLDPHLAAFDNLFGRPDTLAAMIQPAMPALGVFYLAWHLVNLGGIVWVLHWQTEARGRLVLAFLLTWLIGMIAAYVFSSAGPIFTGRYDPAMAPDSIQQSSSILWNNYQSKGALLGAGISAFPSMHVAIAMWIAYVLREKGLWAVGLAYVAAIYVCSVLLGWHYSLDGAGGILVAMLSYYLASQLMIWRRRPLELRSNQAPTPTLDT